MSRTKIILIVALSLLLVACITGSVLFLHHGGGSGPRPPTPKPPGPRPPAPPSKGAALYLLPERDGFTYPDIKLTTSGYLIDPTLARKMFPGGIVAIANNAGDLESQWNNVKITKLVNASGLPLRKWITFYFGKDGSWCRCQNGAWTDKSKPAHLGEVQCSGPNKPCPNCKNSTDWVKWDLNTCSLCKTDNDTLCLTGTNSVVNKILGICEQHPDLDGIMFDDEVGDPTYIIAALEGVKTLWDNSHSKKLLLGWTATVSSANLPRPRNLQGKYTWDVCLGQAYTDTTGTYYEDSCTPAKDWWTLVGKALGSSPPSRGVPMVCGAGNCIGDQGKGSAPNDKWCIDERLSGDVITTLLQDRPSNFPWKNFAIWYGDYDENTGFFGCTNSGCKPDKGCCKGWKCKLSGCTPK